MLDRCVEMLGVVLQLSLVGEAAWIFTALANVYSWLLAGVPLSTAFTLTVAVRLSTLLQVTARSASMVTSS